MSLFGKKEGDHDPTDPSVRGSYGVADIVRLMRTLPVEKNAELVVEVVRSTLESVRVRVADIIEDAVRKQQELSEHVAKLQSEILQLESDISVRREEIAGVEAELAEVTAARQRLELAERRASSPHASAT
jgi:chromosome segregation ATPase